MNLLTDYFIVKEKEWGGRVMLKDKMLWMKDSGNIRDEIRQCREEGRMISGLLPPGGGNPEHGRGAGERKLCETASSGAGKLSCG